MPIYRYATLPADRVFNLTSPRYTPEISRIWRGQKDWHDPQYDPVRDLIERMYIDGFNTVSGHFYRLENSIASEGIRNPIMVSNGALERRGLWELPPDRRNELALVSEYMGGSRLWVAQKLGMEVPCIVSDHTGEFDEGVVLETEDDILDCFRDRPQILPRGAGLITVVGLPYTHLPKDERYTVSEQIRLRRGIIEGIQTAVNDWLRNYDAP